jgi:transposase
MSPVTTHAQESTPTTLMLHLAFELADQRWKLAFTPGLGQRPRVRTVSARDLDAVRQEITRALARFGLPATTPVVSCYEAGRDGFWLHRALTARGIGNQIVDSASIEINRRLRRAKADRLDAEKLVLMLVRATQGDPRVWRVVRVPSEADEAARQLSRELDAVAHDRTQVLNRMHGLLATEGVQLALTGDVPAALAAVRRWDGTPLPAELVTRLERDWRQSEALTTRRTGLQAQRRQDLVTGTTPAHAQMRQLARLSAVGVTTATVLVREFFGWRAFRNRRQVGGCAGLTATPFQTGGTHREQGISKAGNRRVRTLMIELAWGWLRYQPQSELSAWYRTYVGGGGARQRRVGIVALARKLLIALWRYLETGTVPAGARLKA